MMLFIQVILGGSAVLLDTPVIYHLVWGTLIFIMLIVTSVFASRAYGTGSTLFKVGLAGIVDFVIQGLIGLFSFNQGVPLVVHLTNAFLLAVIVTYLVSFADSADKASIALPSKIQTAPGTMSP
jgi:heme A synthase